MHTNESNAQSTAGNTKRFLLLAFITVISVSVEAFNSDSLQNALVSSTGRARMEILQQLSAGFASSDIQKSIGYDSLALEIAIALNDEATQSNILNNLAISLYSQSEYANAINLLQKSLAIKEAIGDTVEVVKTLNNLGAMYQIIGDYKSSVTLLERALEMRRRQGDSVGIARTLINISSANSKAGHTHQSLKKLSEALEIFRALDDEAGIASVHNSLGIVYQQMNSFPEAKKHFLLSLTLKDEAVDPRGAANTYNNLGMVEESLGNYRSALDFYNRAMEIRTSINDLYGLSTVNSNKGRLFRLMKRFVNAEQYLLEGLRIASEGEFLEQQLVCNRELALLYTDWGKPSQAASYAMEAMELQGLLYNQQLSARIAELDSQRKTDKLYQEHEILKLENTLQGMKIKRKQNIGYAIILFTLMTIVLLILIWRRLKENRRMNTDLAATVDELTTSRKDLEDAAQVKNRFFSIIAHDLRSPFNTILGYSELMPELAAKKEWNELTAAAGALRITARNAYTLLENLLEWTHSQTGRMPFHPTTIRIGDLVSTELLLLNEQASQKGIATYTSVPDGLTGFVDRQMFSSIVRNLVSNAIKFSWPGEKVVFRAMKTDDQLHVSVEDHGIGISAEIQSKLFQPENGVKRPGTEQEQGTGLGLTLARDFAERHGGTLEIQSKVGKGTTVIVIIPEQKPHSVI
jgi:signal transduction histidine kinase